MSQRQAFFEEKDESQRIDPIKQKEIYGYLMSLNPVQNTDFYTLITELRGKVFHSHEILTINKAFNARLNCHALREKIRHISDNPQAQETVSILGKIITNIEIVLKSIPSVANGYFPDLAPLYEKGTYKFESKKP